MPVTTCIFDAYGTVLENSAATREAFADIWPKVANDWRLKQLLYTWLHAVARAQNLFFGVLVSLALSTSALLAETQMCDDPLVSAEAPNNRLIQATCIAVEKAKLLLSQCDLTQREPIEIAIVEDLSHPMGDCLAYYECAKGRIEVVNPARFSEIVPEDEARALLPADILFQSLITHEMTHALVQQSATETEIRIVDQEFLANAFEMESIDPRWRNALLEVDPIEPPGKKGLVHPAIYGLAPRAFANNAWQLFHAEQNECDLVQKIIEGSFTFAEH